MSKREALQSIRQWNLCGLVNRHALPTVYLSEINDSKQLHKHVFTTTPIMQIPVVFFKGLARAPRLFQGFLLGSGNKGDTDKLFASDNQKKNAT